MARQSLTERFDQWLDESCEVVDILGKKYNPSDVLKEVDLKAYREALWDFEENNPVSYEKEPELNTER